MCYYRDRSRKVFPASHGTVKSTPRARSFQGQISGNQVLGQQQLDAEHKPCANREPLPKSSG